MINIESILRETGSDVRNEVREDLPNDKPDEEAEKLWAEGLTENSDYNAVVVGEEGKFIEEDDPDYAFLVDPLDGTSGAVNGEFPWVTTAVTVLDEVDVNGDRVSGTPCGAYIRQLGGNDTEFYSWNGEASINGEVRFTQVEDKNDLPGTVNNTEIMPRQLESFDELTSDRKGLVSVYAAKKSRRPVREHFLEPLEDLDGNVRTGLTGGSYTGASVGWGKTLVAGEPKPTLPTEAAGEIFATAMGAEASDIYGGENETITVEMENESPERSYTAVISANQGIHNEALTAIDVEELEGSYDEFSTYQKFR